MKLTIFFLTLFFIFPNSLYSASFKSTLKQRYSWAVDIVEKKVSGNNFRHNLIFKDGWLQKKFTGDSFGRVLLVSDNYIPEDRKNIIDHYVTLGDMDCTFTLLQFKSSLTFYETLNIKCSNKVGENYSVQHYCRNKSKDSNKQDNLSVFTLSGKKQSTDVIIRCFEKPYKFSKGNIER